MKDLSFSSRERVTIHRKLTCNYLYSKLKYEYNISQEAEKRKSENEKKIKYVKLQKENILELSWKNSKLGKKYDLEY